jgi:hypothetical protein
VHTHTILKLRVRTDDQNFSQLPETRVRALEPNAMNLKSGLPRLEIQLSGKAFI